MKGKICVAIAEGETGKAVEMAKKVRSNLVEIRIDFLKKPDLEKIRDLVRTKDVILTVRRKGEGGKFEGSEEERKELTTKCISLRPKFIDVELDSEIVRDVIREAKRKGVKVILSHHNFGYTPDSEDLKLLKAMAKNLGADAFKVVTLARKPEDNMVMFNLILERKMPIIAFCMGGLGLPSRIFSPLFGSELTYACVEESFAPGQINFELMAKIMEVVS